MMRVMEHLITNQDLQFILALSLSLISGVAIGIEREFRRKPAGISTQMLVIGASATFTYISQLAGGSDHTRIAAQIVSGVGFLGAGIILHTGSDKVSNLTTAASLWYSSAIGMAFGFNYYLIGILAVLYALIASRMPKINKRDPDEPSSSQ